jgi:hypothetical protein
MIGETTACSALRGGLVRVGDRGLPLPLTRELIDLLTYRPTGRLVLPCLIFIVRRDLADQDQALRKSAVKLDGEPVAPGNSHNLYPPTISVVAAPSMAAPQESATSSLLSIP